MEPERKTRWRSSIERIRRASFTEGQLEMRQRISDLLYSKGYDRRLSSDDRYDVTSIAKEVDQIEIKSGDEEGVAEPKQIPYCVCQTQTKEG